MAAKLIVTGFASEPVQRTTNGGKPLLDISVAHNERTRDRQTGEWSNAKDQDGNDIVFWTRATFFEDEAIFLANVIRKGDRIELEGEPRVRAFVNKTTGQPQAGVELRGAVVKVLPRAPRQDGQGGFGQPAAPQGVGGWANAPAAGGFDDEPAF